MSLLTRGPRQPVIIHRPGIVDLFIPTARCKPAAVAGVAVLIIKLLALIAVAGLFAGASQAQPKPEPAASAMLQIRVPLLKQGAKGAVHVWEECSGTLVDRHRGTVLTAWHCFDGGLDLTRPPLALIGDQWQPLRLGKVGGSMHDDWALTFLSKPILPSLQPLPVSFTAPAIGDALTMLGFQSPATEGTTGARVLVSATCNVTGIGPHWTQTDCRLAKGASGGAVISGQGVAANLVGIVSAQKSDQGVMFIPLSKLERYFSPP